MLQVKPREKLNRYGVESLTDSELLAIFLRTGSKGMSVFKLSANMLSQFGSLYNILTANSQAMASVKGVGEAKLAQLHAVAELAKRFFATQLLKENVITSPQSTLAYLQSILAHQERELFVVLYLDSQHGLLGARQMFAGSINSVEVHPRDIIKEALKMNAAAMILSHNHPSGLAEPSQADRLVTDKIKQAAKLFNINVLDHIVIAGGCYVSFAERGWI